jgi:hypothetical protein
MQGLARQPPRSWQNDYGWGQARHLAWTKPAMFVFSLREDAT